MIELLLAAERLLEAGDLDHAERLFSQVAEADPQNAIAVAGLAEVALARGDVPEAAALARRALAIDPEDVAARRLIDRLEATPQPELAPELEAARDVPPKPVPVPVRRSLLARILAFFGRR
ncbi:MAG TPA: tetratricopeptide repeat protein [Candidatus Limnocylindrales bacterium]|nr:tetratricopeptide repeat protein [Candidatus Limnocylindrales bacterium]